MHSLLHSIMVQGLLDLGAKFSAWLPAWADLAILLVRAAVQAA